jgi:hypothetical protein
LVPGGQVIPESDQRTPVRSCRQGSDAWHQPGSRAKGTGETGAKALGELEGDRVAADESGGGGTLAGLAEGEDGNRAGPDDDVRPELTAWSTGPGPVMATAEVTGQGPDERAVRIPTAHGDRIFRVGCAVRPHTCPQAGRWRCDRCL